MSKQLKLGDDQQAKVKPILEEQRNQMEQLRNDSSMSRDDKLAKMRDLHEQSSNQIKAISTATSKRNSTKFSRNAKLVGTRVNPKIAKSLILPGA
jgi:hypothetical protein